MKKRFERRLTDRIMLFPGVDGDKLAKLVAKRLGMQLSPVKFVRFQGATRMGGETKPEILCNVMHHDCVVIWSPTNTNDELMQVCQLINALKRQGEARHVTLVVSCFPNARQDKSHARREPITAKLTAKILETAGMDKIVYLDIHAEQIEGFFDKAVVRGLWMDAIWVDFLRKKLATLLKHLGLKNNQVRNVPPDEGAVSTNYRIAKLLGSQLAIHLKKRDWTQKHSVTSMGIKGSVVKCLVYDRDDLLASGDSLFAAASAAKRKGAKYVIALVTHAIGFNKKGAKDFAQKLLESDIDELIVTNSLTHFCDRVRKDPRLQEKVTIIDISPYIATVIDRFKFSVGETVRDMMREVKPEDLYEVCFISQQARKVEESVKK